MKVTRKSVAGKLRSPPRSPSRSKTLGGSLVVWQRRAESVVEAVIEDARAVPELRKMSPAARWVVEVDVVGASAMRRMNREVRGKDRPTDVLSFELPAEFRKQGLIGQLVLCLPVLKAQARELKHAEKEELRVLIVHGFLHLLGFDHEKGPAAARKMARLEARLLGKKTAARGLILRNHSCTE
jgi:probable rRNA maturation factor